MSNALCRAVRPRIVKVGLAAVMLALAALALTTTRAQAQGSATRLELVASHDLASLGLDGLVKPRGQNGEVAVLGNTAFVAGGSLYHGARASAGRICTDYGGVKNVDLSDPANPVNRTSIDVNDPGGVGAPWLAANPRRNQQFRNVSVTAIAVDTLSSADFASNTGNPATNVLAVGGARCEPSFFAGGRIDLFDIDDPASPVSLGSYVLPAGLGTLEDVQIFARGGKVYALATIPFNRGQGTRGDLRLVDITVPQSPVEIAAGEFPAGPPAGPDAFSSRNGCQSFLGGKAVAPTPNGDGAFLSFYDGSTNLDPANTQTEAVFKLGLAAPIASAGPTSLLGSWGYTPANPAVEGTGADDDVEGNAADLETFPGAQGDNLVMVSEDDLDPALTTLQIQNPASAASTWRACQNIVTKKLYRLPGQGVSADIAYLGRGCPGSKLSGSLQTGDEAYTEDPNGKIALLEVGPSPFDGCSQFERAKRAIDAGAVAVMASVGENLLNSTNNGPAGGIPDQPYMTITQDAYLKMQLVRNPFPSSAAAFTGNAVWKRTTATNVTAVASYPNRTDRFRFRSQADATDPVARGETNDLNPGSVCGTGTTCRFAVTAGQQFRAGAFMQLESWTAGTFRTAVAWYDSGGVLLSDSQIGSRTSAPSARSLEAQTVTAPANATSASVKFEWAGGGAGVGFADNFFVVPAGLSGRLGDAQGQWGAQRILDFSPATPVNVGTYRSPRSLLWPPPDEGLYAPRAAKIVGDRAFTTWLSDGLRVLDVSDPADPKQIASFVPPATADPSPQAGAGSTATPPRTDSASLELRRGASWPTVPLVTGVDVLRGTSGQATHVVASDINGGLFVLCVDLACPAPTDTGGGGGRANYSQPYPNPTSPFAGCSASTANVILGTAGNDVRNGTLAGDRIFAAAGNDIVDALAGNDCVDLGAGNDRGAGGAGRDLILGQSGADRISASSGNDRIRGGPGGDRIGAGSGNDRALGNAGNDRIVGGSGNDVLDGVSGKDRVSGGRGRDRINGGAGKDRISGGGSNDRIRGGSGGDRISGNSGRDTIRGNSGNDRIGARDGRRDRINCGAGRDTVIADRIDRVSPNCERVRRI